MPDFLKAAVLPFENSRQAQFLIPIDSSIAFSLGFTTLLVLLFIPSLRYMMGSMRVRLGMSVQLPRRLDSVLGS